MGRGAYDTTGKPKPKPPPKRGRDDAHLEEMNRREKTDQEFDTTTPRTDHQVKELKDKKSKEERRRAQWDLNQKSQSRATAAGSSTVAPKTSKEPKAAKSKSRHGLAKVQELVTKLWTKAKSKSRRGLAKVQELVRKLWTKAPEASGIGGHKEGEEKNGKKHDKKKNGKKQEKKKNGKKQEKKKNGKKLEKKKNR